MQWDDIQKKLGYLPPKPPAFKPPPFSPAEDQDSKCKDKAWINDNTEEELKDLEDDLDDDRCLLEYRNLNRKKRLAEMREAAKIAKFGSVMPISGSDFVREVSQAEPDVWVVAILYKDSAVEANYVGRHSFGRKCTAEVVALVLCQSDPVLNDGQGGSEQSKEDVLDGVRKSS